MLIFFNSGTKSSGFDPVGQNLYNLFQIKKPKCLLLKFLLHTVNLFLFLKGAAPKMSLQSWLKMFDDLKIKMVKFLHSG